MSWEHPTLVCSKHKKPFLITRSGEVFCWEGLDENRNPTCEVPKEGGIPKEVARAMDKVRKRTRRMLAKKAECTCGGELKNDILGLTLYHGHGHSRACARWPYEEWKYKRKWRRKRK